MCGICGIVSSSLIDQADISLLGEMNEALVHRGPDASGTYRSSNIALAMRRLKIIDLEGGDQPLYNEDNSLVLVANSEIYNHVELRAELEKKGHVFRTRSDCETILHLYEEEGQECVRKLRGMFAFALYDSRRAELLLARDRLSEKPLYYHRSEERIVFSSEMKSLLCYLRSEGMNINHDALNMYFYYQYVPEPYTCIEGVRKLQVAHYMTVSIDDFSINLKKYWDIEDAEPVLGNPAELIREAFDDVSRIIIRADVPVGVSLSGGIDSGAIAVYAARHYGKDMHAFSVGYPGRPSNDERAMAQKLAEKVGLTYHDVELSTEDFVRQFPKMVYYMDDPIADIAAFGYYSVSRLAREHDVPVLLHGLGGDELFWGYGWVRKAVEKSLLKRQWLGGKARGFTLLKGLLVTLKHINRHDVLYSPMGTVKKLLYGIAYDRTRFRENPERFIFIDEQPDFVNAAVILSSLTTDEFERQRSEVFPYSFFTSSDWDNVPMKICRFLFETWLYSNCVALSDRMSMASSVENRLPFLDYRFVELVMGLRKAQPGDFRLGYKKWFIEAMQDIIPGEVLGRKKMGFTPPVSEWYRAIVLHYGKAFCHDGYLASHGLLDRDRLVDFIDRAAKSGGEDLFFAYKIVLFEVWHRVVVCGEGHA